MLRVTVARIVALAFVGTIGVAIGCTESQDCSCDDPAVTVDADDARATEVKSVTGGGIACSGVTATCQIQGTLACAEYALVPTQAGECDVIITFVDGSTQTGSFVFGADAPTCCGDLSGGGQLSIMPPATLGDAASNSAPAADASEDARAD